MTDLVKSIVGAMASEVLAQLELTKQIEHPGESGRAREQIVASFLRRLLPPSVGIDTGFVIDSSGAVSRQLDIVVYRTDYHPILEIGGVKHFLVESVVMVIENKARITEEKVLRAAIDNVASVKALDRSNGGRNHVFELATSGPYEPTTFRHQVFGAIITERSMARASVMEQLMGFVSSHPRELWPNLYVDVGEFVVSYMAPGVPPVEEDQTTSNTQRADRLCASQPGGIAPLVELAQEVTNFVRVSPIVDFLPSAYFYERTGQVDWARIPDQQATPGPAPAGSTSQ